MQGLVASGRGIHHQPNEAHKLRRDATELRVVSQVWVGGDREDKVVREQVRDDAGGVLVAALDEKSKEIDAALEVRDGVACRAVAAASNGMSGGASSSDWCGSGCWGTSDCFCRYQSRICGSWV